jgi:hypothetical protein
LVSQQIPRRQRYHHGIVIMGPRGAFPAALCLRDPAHRIVDERLRL